MKKILIAVLLTLMVGCGDVGPTTKLKQTRNDKSFTMTVEIVEEDHITKVCDALGAGSDKNGCAAFDLDAKSCTIYVMPQRHAHDTERLALVGHETWHCRYGVWHD